MRKLLSVSKGLSVSPPIRVNGGVMISLRGPFGTVMTYASVQGWNPRNIVAFGQNGGLPGMTKLEMEAHMIVVVGEQSMAEVAGSINKTILDALMQEGFDYANMIAGFYNGVQLVNFGGEFAANPFGEMIIDAIFATFFTSSMFLKNSGDFTNALLLIGQGDDRAMCAKIAGRNGTYKLLPSPFDQIVDPRHTVVGKNILLAAEFGQNKVYGVQMESIANYLQNAESTLVWTGQQIGYKIEDFAVVDGSHDTVILTIAEGEFRLIPTVVRFNGTHLEFRPSMADGVRLEDLGGEILSPIVRIARNGEITLADRHNHTTFIRFEQPANFGPKFEQMVARAASHRLSAHRAVQG